MSVREDILLAEELDELFPRYDHARIARDRVDEREANLAARAVVVGFLDGRTSLGDQVGVRDRVRDGDVEQREREMRMRVDDVLQRLDAGWVAASRAWVRRSVERAALGREDPHARRKAQHPVALLPLGRHCPQHLVDARRRIRDHDEIVGVAIDKLGEASPESDELALVVEPHEAVGRSIALGLDALESFDDGQRCGSVRACGAKR